MKQDLHSLKDILRQFRLLGHFVVLVYRRFKEERCFQLCGSLTFTTMLALVPLVTIMATVMTAFPVFDGIVGTLRTYVAGNLVPAGSSKLVTVYMQQFAENAARLTALGIVLLAAAAIMLMLTIDRAFNTIWRVKRPRSLIQRVLIYWSVLTIGPMLIGGSLSLTSWLVSQSLGVGRQAPELMVAVLKLGPLFLTSVAFGFLYRTVPNRQVTVLDAVVGGIIAAFAFEAMKIAFGHFIANFASYKLVYGTFASLPILLTWIYLNWVVIVFAAVITAVLPYWRSGGVLLKQAPGTQFVSALEILKLLYRAYLDGYVLNLHQLRTALRLLRLSAPRNEIWSLTDSGRAVSRRISVRVWPAISCIDASAATRIVVADREFPDFGPVASIARSGSSVQGWITTSGFKRRMMSPGPLPSLVVWNPEM